MHAKHVILTFLAMPKTTLPSSVLRPHYNRHFVTFLLESGLRFALGPSYMIFSRIFCKFNYVNLIANLDHERDELSC